MTWLEDGLPSALRPGRRPRTTLSPTLVLRDGEPVLALGTPGGDQQDQWQLSSCCAHLATGYSLQAGHRRAGPAHHAFPARSGRGPATPGGVVVEAPVGRGGHRRAAPARAPGHVVSGDWSLGRLSAVARDPATGLLAAAANPRGTQGYAVGR